MKVKLALLLVIFMSILAGCGGPKADVTIFMMGPQGIPGDAADKLKSSLVVKVGPTPTLDLHASPIFSLEKMVVEIAAGENGILILPEDYPSGIIEMTDEGKTEKHLYGIPLEDTKWMKELNMNGKGLVAFIAQNAKNKEQAKHVIKIIAEK